MARLGYAPVLNQIIAALVHLAHAETSALPQNGVLLVMALLAAVLARK